MGEGRAAPVCRTRRKGLRRAALPLVRTRRKRRFGFAHPIACGEGRFRRSAGPRSPFRRGHGGNAQIRQPVQRRPPQGVELRSGGKGRPVHIESDVRKDIGRAARFVNLRAHARFVQRFRARRLHIFAHGFKGVRPVGNAQAHALARPHDQMRRQMRRSPFLRIAFPRRAHLPRVCQTVYFAPRRDARPGAALQLERTLLPARAFHQHILRIHIAPQNAVFAHEHAHVVGTFGIHQRRVVHVAQIAAAEAAAVENLQKRFAIGLRNGFSIKGAAVDARYYGHVFRPFQPPLDFEGNDAGPLHGLQAVQQHQIARGKQIAARLPEPVGQAAGLGAHAPVAAAAAHQAGKQALAGAGNAQRSMAEGLQFHAQTRALFDFRKGHFPRQHGAIKAVGAQVFHALPVVHGHLRAGMQRKARRQTTHTGGYAQILHNHGIRPRGGDFGNLLFQRRHLVFAHQRVERHMRAHAAGMTIGDRLLQAAFVEVVRAPTGVEQARAKVNRVRAVLNRGDERFHAPGGSKQFAHLRAASSCFCVSINSRRRRLISSCALSISSAMFMAASTESCAMGRRVAVESSFSLRST